MLMSRIANTADWSIANHMKAQLEEQGFHVAELSNINHVMFAGADQGYYIEVLPAYKEAASACLDELGFADYILADD